MLWARWIIFGVPSLLAALTVWSARQAATARATRGDAVVLASGEGISPTLNPFLPACEVDRSIAALVHEPLLRIGPDGRISPALAASWSWSQTSRVWFAAEPFAREAAARLSRVDAATRSELGFLGAETDDRELRLRFASPGTRGAKKLLPAIADCGPLPVEFVRVELAEPARSYHEFFMKTAVERDQVKAVWYDGTGAYELAISGETVKFIQELNLYYQNRPNLRPHVGSLGSAPMLHRPVLEITLREDAKFSDGTALTCDDLEATVSLVQEQPWPIPGRDAFRLVAGLEKMDPRHERITFKEIHGPAITAFLDFPVLPASWIARHRAALARDGGRAFVDDPPPGAGGGRVAAASARAITVQDGRRVEFLLGQSPEVMRFGFAMGAIDGFWPRWQDGAAFGGSRDFSVSLTPARSRLLVLWNCRKPPLDDARVRTALGLAVDRGKLARDLALGQGMVHEGIFRPGLWFAQPIDPAPPAPLEARRILEEMGWVIESGLLAKGGKPLRIELLTIAGNRERADLAERLRQAWAALGIGVTVTPVAADELVNLRLPEHRFDAVLLGLDFETSWDQSPFWHSTQARGGLNFSGLADPTLDGLLEALRAEFDPGKVPTLAHEVENRILSHHAFFPLISGGNPVVIRKSGSDVSEAVAEIAGLARQNDK